MNGHLENHGALAPRASGLGTRDIGTQLAAIGLGTVFLTLSAKIQIPFWPVPMTLQTLAVCLLGAGLGSRVAGATVAAYLLEGALGLPVLAGTPERGLGLAYMTGPTGGFLVGFLIAALLVGWLAEQGWTRSWVKAISLMIVGHAVMFLAGILYLAPTFGWQKAIAVGLTPFITATIVKVALGAVLVRLALGLNSHEN